MIGQLAINYPASDWAKVAKGSFMFGSGGIGGTGAQCGNFISTSAVLKQMGAGNDVVDMLLRWFETTPIPSNAGYIDYRTTTWEPPNGWGAGGMPIPLNNAPKVKSMTTTCHGAHSKWKAAAGSWLNLVGAAGNTDRCSKSTYDVVYKLASLINEWKAGTMGAVPADAVVNGCKVSECHGSTYPTTGIGGNKITCQPCHSTLAGVTPGHGQ